MTQTTSQERPKSHGLIAKTFHWGFALVFAYAIYKQIDDVTQLQDTALLHFEIVFAAAFLALLIARFVYMRLTMPTALPETTPKPMKLLARAGHLATYASVGMIADLALVIGAIYGSGNTTGFAIDAAIGVHEAAVTASYAMIALHITAALYHRLKGDGIWSAMVPVFKENR